MKRNSDILLTVLVVTYNQEKYIKKAVDSILNQKVNFDFEVLVGNDNSPDNTENILSAYNKKYNCDLKIYNRKENLGPNKNLSDLMKKAKGKYICILEGDDYWCDDRKLQKQFDFLEKNELYIGVAHDCMEVDLDGKNIMKRSHDLNSKIKKINFKRVEKGYLDYQTNTLFFRNIFLNNKNDSKILYEMDRLVGDRTLALLLTDIGDIYFMEDVMSCYRVNKSKYSITYLEHTIYMLEYLSRLNDFQLKNHKINMKYYMSYDIAGCYLYRMIKKEKNYKYKYSDLNKYIFFPMRLYIIVNMIKIVFNKIVKIIKMH